MGTEAKSTKISTDVNNNCNYLSTYFGNGIGLIESNYTIFENKIKISLAYIESITEHELLMEHVVKPLLNLNDTKYKNYEHITVKNDIFDFIITRVIQATNTSVTSDMSEVVSKLLNGYTVIFINNQTSALLISNQKFEKKSVESPENESTVLGSQESFTDDITTNISLIIKRIPTPEIRFQEFDVGSISHTKVKFIWLDGITNSEIVDEAKSRLGRINHEVVDGIGVLAELIEDKPTSIFPKYRQTERPDVVARNLADGRFAMICSNSPFALIAPVSFWDNFKTTDDYEERFIASSYLRIVRYVAFFLSVFISSLYLSFVTYNQAIIPPALALNIAAGREGVPFPTVIELILLTLAITIIREAGLRMPQSVGYFVGTLAAVVIGQAVVTAGYVSPSLIIVVAISTISSFAISNTLILYPARLLNYFFILMAGLFGIFGVVNGIVLVIWHLVSLRSFGVPYLYPVVPFDKKGFLNTFIRPPQTVLEKSMNRFHPFNKKNKEKKPS